MLKRILPIAAALALVAFPAMGSARVHHAYGGPLTYTYSLVVNSDCSLSQLPGGNFAFAPISGLGSVGENSNENVATTQCESSNSPTLTISDASNTNGPNYTFASSTITYNIQNASGGSGTDYTNSNTSGIALNKTGTVENWALWGWLPGQGLNTPGSYSDTVTLAIINY